MTVIQKPDTIQLSESGEFGFSLIEVAIGLIILGLIIGPLIQTYNTFIQSRQVTISDGITRVVQSSLIKYVEKHGHYPKPANPGIAQGSAGFGAEDTTTPGGWPNCSATSTTVCQTTTNTYGGAVVLIGDVPFATLGLPFKSILDGYNKKLTYAVTLDLTSSSTFDDTKGGIEVLGSTGLSIYDGTTQRSHFVVVSHGENSDGAFNLGGIRGKACGTASTGKEFENCNNDGVFVNNYTQQLDGLTVNTSIRNYANGANYFDDFVSTSNTATTGIWSYILNASGEIKSNNTGNVYVGKCDTFPCIPKSHIDVNGDVKATSLYTNRICNKDSSNCISTSSSTTPRASPSTDGWFSPQMLTGAPSSPATTEDTDTGGHIGGGIRCYDYKALKGIKNYDEICTSNKDTGDSVSPYFSGAITVSNSCTSGQYANKITISGSTITLTCTTPP